MNDKTTEQPIMPAELLEQVVEAAKQFCEKPKNAPHVVITHEKYSLAGLMAFHEGANFVFAKIHSLPHSSPQTSIDTIIDKLKQKSNLTSYTDPYWLGRTHGIDEAVRMLTDMFRSTRQNNKTIDNKWPSESTLPPSPVGEAGDEENPTTIERAILFAQGMVDHSPKDRQYWKGHLDALVFAKELLDESPNPSRAGEADDWRVQNSSNELFKEASAAAYLSPATVTDESTSAAFIDGYVCATNAAKKERAGEISPVEKIATITKQRDNLRMALAELMADIRNAPKEFQRAVNHDMLRASQAIAVCSPPAEPVNDSPVENDRLNKAKDLSLDWFKEKSRADDLTDKLQQAHADIRYWKEQYERLRFPQ